MFRLFVKSHLSIFWGLLYVFLNHNPCQAEVNIESDLLYSNDGSFYFNGSYNSANGTIGVVYNPTSNEIVYKTVSSRLTETEVISTQASEYNLYTVFLVYDSQSNPHIFASSGNEKIVYFYKRGDTWRDITIFQLDKNTYPNLSNAIDDVEIGNDDSVHIICSNDYTIFYISNKNGAWDKEPQIVEEIPEDHVNIEFGWRIYISGQPGMALDRDNNAHIVYSTPYETRYFNNSSGSWAGEDVFRNTNMDYWPAEDPSIAVDMNGNPAIVASEMDHVITGSIIYSKLRYIARSSQSWKSTTIASSADNYVGNDGNKFTGLNAKLAFDVHNHPHIVFSDMASSHNQNGWNYTKNGQIRYAFHNGNKWELSTLHRQSPHDGEMLKLWLGVSPNGDEIHILGQEVIRVGNVYDGYDSETYNLLYVHTPFPALRPVIVAIKANGSEDAVDVNIGDNVEITIEVDPGSYAGEDADWWLALESPFGLYWLAPSLNWEQSLTSIRVYAGPLIRIPAFTVFNSRKLPYGDYTFYFAVDDNMDGVRDTTYMDSVLVNIK